MLDIPLPLEAALKKWPRARLGEIAPPVPADWKCGCHLNHKSKQEHDNFWLRYSKKRAKHNSKATGKKKKKQHTQNGQHHWDRVVELALLNSRSRADGESFYDDYLRHPHWIAKRREALDHYGEKCRRCGSRKRIQVHHKHYRTLFRESMKDLEVLCRKCHKCEHGIE